MNDAIFVDDDYNAVCIRDHSGSCLATVQVPFPRIMEPNWLILGGYEIIHVHA